MCDMCRGWSATDNHHIEASDNSSRLPLTCVICPGNQFEHAGYLCGGLNPEPLSIQSGEYGKLIPLVLSVCKDQPPAQRSGEGVQRDILLDSSWLAVQM